jgi:hypothetical protein
MPVAENHHRGWFGPVLLLLILTGCYWKLVLTNQFTWMQGNDVAYQVLPWFQLQVGEFQQGRFPLWDPYVLGGQPLIGQAQPGTAFPLNWILFAMPTNNGWMRQAILHWYFVVIHYLAALFAYRLCRDLKLNQWASLAGGVLYTLGGFMGHTDWPQMLNGAMWAPLILMYVMRSIRGESPWRNAGLGGIFLGVSVLSGHHQAPIYIALIIGGVWIWGVFREGRPDWRSAARAALFVIVAGMVSGLQSLPALEYSRLAYRWVGVEPPVTHNMKVPYSVHSDYSLRGHSLLGIVFPAIHHHANAYVGFTAMALAVLGCAVWWKRREVKIAAAIAIGGLMMGFGALVFFHGVLYSLAPAVEKARNPSMAVVIFNLGISVLAAYGFQWVSDDGDGVWMRRLQNTGLALAAVVFVGLYLHLLMNNGEFKMGTDIAFTALIATMAAACLYARRQGELGPASAVACLFALMAVELCNGGPSGYPHVIHSGSNSNLAVMSRDRQFMEKLRELPIEARVEFTDTIFRHNVGDWNGIDAWHGYMASMTRNLYETGPDGTRVKEMYGVRYMVAREARQAWTTQVAELQDGLKIFENANALPRAWVVHQVERAVTEEEKRRVLDSPEFDLRRKASVSVEPPKLESCEDPELTRVLSRVSDRVLIYTELNCTGMLVLGDNYYPGWEARGGDRRFRLRK